MHKTRITDGQIMALLKQNEDGAFVSDICTEHSVSSVQSCKWRSKYGGLDRLDGQATQRAGGGKQSTQEGVCRG